MIGREVSRVKKWEYKVLNWDEKITTIKKADNLEEALNDYGYDGWELVSITQQIDSFDGSENNGVSRVETDSIILFLKREIIE